ncbi:tetratricopeptide repeat protein [Corynebacterium halotolerans]|uniref:Thioredoxin domain-containing protein n=1 Tax=Corynebacterium halotolerans YIM 70093 = DSM 44683 TaxID=1121362 RepID=M1NXL7_9CORY|nr:tetratricopeptide repeat protein [Corynebacterium halotolerans]AGF72245.1 hypothetical protein A605_06195 [Corynebacterium halotolerans YIM 70093 = DSM 44683]
MTTPNRFVSGALDLGEVKARAEARQQAARTQQNGQQPAAGGVQPFLTVTPANFEEEVVRRSLQVPVVVLVGTPRSPDSEQLKADLQALASGGGLSFIAAYVDADATPEVAQAFGVTGLPTVIALAAGHPLTNFEGGQPRDAVKQWIDALVQQVGPQLQGLDAQPTAAPQEEPEDPRLDAATSALNTGDFDAAIAIYEDILTGDPKNAEIAQARDTARLLKRLNPAERTDDPVATADADPADVDKQFDAADAEIVAGAPEKAFDRLIALMTTQAGEDRTRVRDRLVELFALFDAADPRVVTARTKMASALF